MQSLIIKYGLICGAIIVGISLVSNMVLGHGPDAYKLSEIIGYSTIVLSLLLIYLAVVEYSRQSSTRSLKFSTALWIGLGVSGIAGILFGIFNWIFVTFIAPDFMDQYYAFYVESIRNSGLPTAQIDSQIAKLESEKSLFMNPFVNFIVMFATVFVIGVIISLFTAVIQSRIRAQST